MNLTADNVAAKTLHFHGPFKFTRADNNLFHSDFAKSEGIYIWTIKDEVNTINYVHYVGETVSFAKLNDKRNISFK